jgi:Rer1 family
MERYIDQPPPPGGGSRLAAAYNQRLQVLLDKAAPWVAARWAVWLALTLLFALRVWWLKGFYIVAYALGIFNLNLLLGFLSPQVVHIPTASSVPMAVLRSLASQRMTLQCVC